ncbi:hypothetical protein [Lysobacter gummosus]|uniref:hypothetical protein n=1 Tax=Lysobacter gummosus TaxID=262324 RepID=UPI00362CA9EB
MRCWRMCASAWRPKWSEVGVSRAQPHTPHRPLPAFAVPPLKKGGRGICCCCCC